MTENDNKNDVEDSFNEEEGHVHLKMDKDTFFHDANEIEYFHADYRNDNDIEDDNVNGNRCDVYSTDQLAWSRYDYNHEAHGTKPRQKQRHARG